MSALTPRELEVLRLLHGGYTVAQIAERNDVAPSTVRSQVRSVLRKLGVNSQLAAAAHYERWGETP
jgi:DNA-binding NarL/FixJ family response regulator